MPFDASSLSAMLGDLVELVSTESPSDDLAALRRSAEVLATQGERRLRTDADIVEREGVSHVRWRVGSGRGPRILLLGHHDTVWPVGTLETTPWSYSDDIVRGPGCFDMKAGIVQAFHALTSDLPDASVTVLITGDEETGSLTSQDLILEEAEGCAAVLVPEPSGDGGALKLARKGTGFFRIDITGKAAHAGLEPERGVNASIAMAHAILAVCDLADSAAGTTVTPTLSAAGTTANTVPDFATFRVDVRAETIAEQSRVAAALRALKANVDGAVLAVHTNSSRAPMERSASLALFGLAGLVAHDLGLPAPKGVAVGGASDGNFTAAAGIPTLDGLGPLGGGAHAHTEHVRASSMIDRVRLLRGLMHRIATTSWL